MSVENETETLCFSADSTDLEEMGKRVCCGKLNEEKKGIITAPILIRSKTDHDTLLPVQFMTPLVQLKFPVSVKEGKAYVKKGAPPPPPDAKKPMFCNAKLDLNSQFHRDACMRDLFDELEAFLISKADKKFGKNITGLVKSPLGDDESNSVTFKVHFSESSGQLRLCVLDKYGQEKKGETSIPGGSLVHIIFTASFYRNEMGAGISITAAQIAIMEEGIDVYVEPKPAFKGIVFKTPPPAAPLVSVDNVWQQDEAGSVVESSDSVWGNGNGDAADGFITAQQYEDCAAEAEAAAEGLGKSKRARKQ